jgi:hypothetical protein
MTRLLVLLLVLLAVAGSGCWHSGEEAKDAKEPTSRRANASAPRLSPTRLRELALTYNVPQQVRQACAEARKLATVRVLCPRLIPDVPLTRIEGLWGSIVVDVEPRFYMLSFNAGGLPGGKRHWITGGGKPSVVDKWVLTDLANEVKGDPRLVQTLTRDGRRVAIYRFPPFPAGGPNGGHWAAFIRVGDEIVFASLHGRRYVEAAVELALALAAQIEPAG